MNTPTTDQARTEVMDRIAALLTTIVIALSIAFCYFASSFCITIILAGFLSILFDPLVTFLEKWRLPRGVSAALLILLAMLGLGFASQAIFTRASAFADNLPAYADQLHELAAPLSHKMAKVEETAGKLQGETPAKPAKSVAEVRVKQPPSWPSYLLRGFGPFSSAVLVLGAVPFLMFFILSRKEKWYRAVACLFGPCEHAESCTERMATMIRHFVLSNLAVGLLLSCGTTCLLFLFHIRGALFLGLISGVLNLVPFLGAILAAVVPMAAGLAQTAPLSTTLLIGAVIGLMHVFAANLLIPRFIGSRINIGPVVAIAGILFWGWLWGTMGILLAIPLTGIVKLIADCRPSLARVSALLGSATELPQSPKQIIGEPLAPGHPVIAEIRR